MKLSMWILQKWFEKSNPTAIILDGSRIIEGTRLYSDGEGLDDRHVSICQTRDIYPNSTSDQVMIVFRNDMISLETDDKEEVLNRVIAAFEFFNGWERRLETAIVSETPEQAIVDACSELTGPMFIMDGSLSIVAHSKGYAPGEVNNFWDDAVLGLGNAFPDVKTAIESNFSKMHFIDHPCTAFQDDSAAPYRYGISSSVHDAVGNAMGQMVIASKTPMGAYEMQIAQIASEALDRSRIKRAIRKSAGYSESILYDLLAGTVDERDAVRKLLLMQDWKPDDRFVLFRAHEDAMSKPALLTLQRLMAQTLPDCVVVAHDDAAVGIIRASAEHGPREMLLDMAQTNALRIGVSNAFRGSTMGNAYAQQAADALRLSGEGERYCEFYPHALATLALAPDRAYATACAHPAAMRLIEWDAAHTTKLASTLSCFLLHERSYVKTARALFVHRNTVLYRVERALEIAPVDLDDAYERNYLMVSFLICEPRDVPLSRW